jgi:hypothetical protein
MHSTRAVVALDGLARRDDLSAAERARIVAVLRPAFGAAVHGLAVALDALDGPDPEVAAMYARDALVSLGEQITRDALRLPLG